MKRDSTKLDQLPNKSSSDAVNKIASTNSISIGSDNAVTTSQISEPKIKNAEFDGVTKRLSIDSTVQEAESEKKKLAPTTFNTSIGNRNSKKYNIENFKIEKMVEDGNCAFRACAYLLYNDQYQHKPIRKNVFDFVVNNWKDNVELLNATRQTVGRAKFENSGQYITCMGRDGEFGTAFEIGIMVRLYNINITILHQVGNEYQLVSLLTNPTISTEKPGYFLFTGSWINGHINVLKEKKESRGTSLNVVDDTTNSKGLFDHDKVKSLIQPINSNDTSPSEKLKAKVSDSIRKNSNPKMLEKPAQYDIFNFEEDDDHEVIKPFRRKFPQVRGDERAAIKETLKISSVRDVYSKDIETTNEDMFWRENTGGVRDMNVYYKNRSEDKQQQKSDKYCTEYHELVELYVNLSKQSDSPMPSIGLPLKMNMYNKNQLEIVYASSLPVVLYVCATLVDCIVPQFLEIGDIMYYALLYEGTKTKVTIAELVTMDNREMSLRQFWIEFKTFVFEEKRRWPYFNVLIVDWQWKLIQSIVEAWNEQPVIKYVEDVYKFITNLDPLPNMSTIMCCSDSVMRKISTDLDRYSLNAKAHVFHLKSITLLTLCRELEEIEAILNDLFKIMLYKSEEKIEQSVIIIENQIKGKQLMIKEILARAGELSVGGKEFRNNMRILHKYEGACPDEIKSPFHKKLNPNWIARKTSVNNKEEQTDEVSNDLYAPDVGEYLMKHFVHTEKNNLWN
ncbi:hypothetical protein KQX54_015038 [Cotesia glomerata]|uniref:OTU domain-containing protein n=1 Tax=Cotesia glomerata TaxID=32391 RepID=A0AAV7IWR5_COTGL|nr:hypothetical protein KQX54_015038 [Cotesia glomerata]